MTISNEPAPITRNITSTEGISVKDLAEKLGIRAKDVIARLVVRGVFATINQTLDSISNHGDIKAGDVIEAFVTERIAAEAIK